MATDQHGRPIREVPNDTTNEELAAGHIIPGTNPPRNEDARGGFGNRDGKQGYGTDSEDGSTAVSVNEAADADGHPADNMRTTDEGRPTKGESEDVALSLDELEPYSDAAERQSIEETEIFRRSNRPATSDTGPSGDSSIENLLTEDGNNVRRDQRISGQDMTFEDLDASGTNADLTDPDAQRGGIDHQI
jgi:hypothetical protein